MSGGKTLEREIIYSLEEIPEFASEDEEREWWATHDLAEELGTDVTEEHHALIRHLKAAYRHVPERALESKATDLEVEQLSEDATTLLPKSTITLRLDETVLERLQRLAAARNVDYHALARVWLVERLQEEEKATA